jgi:hypothetical protein
MHPEHAEVRQHFAQVADLVADRLVAGGSLPSRLVRRQTRRDP